MQRHRSKVGPKGETVIPKPVRDALGIHPGDEVFFSTHDRHARMEKAGSNDWDTFIGRMPTLHLPKGIDLDDWVDEEMERDRKEDTG